LHEAWGMALTALPKLLLEMCPRLRRGRRTGLVEEVEGFGAEFHVAFAPGEKGARYGGVDVLDAGAGEEAAAGGAHGARAGRVRASLSKTSAGWAATGVGAQVERLAVPVWGVDAVVVDAVGDGSSREVSLLLSRVTAGRW